MSYLQKRGFASAFAFLLVLCSLPCSASNKKPSGQVVDSGTFGIYIGGKRVASETFEITQTPEISVAKAELKVEQAKNPQIAELQLTPSGNLIRYQWSEKDQGSAVVEPKDEFLVEHVVLTQTGKTAEQPYILPISTLILDDYFFSQRQILLWRYLATQCRSNTTDKGCPLAPAQYGVIVPRQQTSVQITVAYAGPEKLKIKGSDMDLSRFELKVEGNSWQVWMDGAYKIQKIRIEADNTEVYRD